MYVLLVGQFLPGSGLTFSLFNNIQIIYFFPTWNLNIPNHYVTFLDCLSSSSLNFAKWFGIENVEVQYQTSTVEEIKIKYPELFHSEIKNDTQFINNAYQY